MSLLKTKFLLFIFFSINIYFIECQSKNGLGYGSFNPYGAKHGGRINEESGGTCTEFLRLNGINQCCAARQDDCYMIHYDTRCYCDVFCDRKESDCCPDAIGTCKGGGLVEPITVTFPPDEEFCEKEGKLYYNNDQIVDNCNTCTCVNGHWFCDNEKRCLIDGKLMKNINTAGVSWKAGNYSNFWGKKLDYGYARKLGTKLSAERQKPMNPRDYFKISDTNKVIPETYDFRKDPEVKDSLRTSPIRDQGECAASWAFSTIDVATDRLVKVTKGRHGNRTSYSVQQLISCIIQKNDKDGCDGSTVDIAWNRINHNNKNDPGVVEEKCQGYSNGESEKAKECLIRSMKPEILQCPDDPENAQYDDSILLASPAYPLKVDSDEDIQREILTQGPVQAIFRVHADFFMYKSGVYEPFRPHQSDPVDAYHSVKLLGWGIENEVPYWLCANSWGDNWGENGYFKIKRGVAEINNHIHAAWGNGKINGKFIFNTKHFNNHVMNMYMSN